jgi:hypothetical protein
VCNAGSDDGNSDNIKKSFGFVHMAVGAMIFQFCLREEEQPPEYKKNRPFIYLKVNEG